MNPETNPLALLPDAPRLSILIVNYNSWPETEQLLNSLLAGPTVSSGRCELIVVDNNSDTPAPNWLSRDPRVQLILCPDNAGFASGVNTGLKASSSDWILLLNPDVVVQPSTVPDILGRIVSYEGRPHPQPSVVGFQLLNPDGSTQPSVGSFPTLIGSIREIFVSRQRRKYLPINKVEPGLVPWITGACMLIRTSLLRQINGFDEHYFLYFEEVDCCRRATNLGAGVEFDPSVSVTHLNPLQRRSVSPKLRVITRHSKLLYFRKHRGFFEFTALALLTFVEAQLRWLGSWLVFNQEETKAWATISKFARTVFRKDWPLGREVGEIAESISRDPLVQPPDTFAKITRLHSTRYSVHAKTLSNLEHHGGPNFLTSQGRVQS